MEVCQSYKYMEKEKKLYTPQILIYCEGSTDKYFVDAIKCAYGNDRRFIIKGGNGGSPDEVVTKCKNVHGEYERYCVIDGTPKISQTARKMASKANITLVEIIPFLECVELNFLKNTDDHLKGENKNSAKKKMKEYVADSEEGELEALLSATVTIKSIKAKRHLLGGFVQLIDLFEKYKTSSYKSS